MMSPADVELLLFYRWSPFPHEKVDPGNLSETMRGWIERGILEQIHDLALFRLTKKGDVFVEMILATPEPVNLWIDPREVHPSIIARRMSGLPVASPVGLGEMVLDQEWPHRGK